MARGSYYTTHKYGTHAATLKGSTKADAAMVIVLGGNLGTGYGFAGPAMITKTLPEVLRNIANKIEADLEEKRAIPPDRAIIYPTDGSEIRDLSPQHVVVDDPQQGLFKAKVAKWLDSARRDRDG